MDSVGSGGIDLIKTLFTCMKSSKNKEENVFLLRRKAICKIPDIKIPDITLNIFNKFIQNGGGWEETTAERILLDSGGFVHI